MNADVIIVNARIYTVDSERPHAVALAIVGEIIVSVGLHEDVRHLVGPATQVIDAGGQRPERPLTRVPCAT